jgi:hypothetical protein
VTLDATTDYERWTLGLRAWRADPSTDLSGLPALQMDSLPPAAFTRLLRHLNEAVDEFMKRWHDQFIATTANVRDEREIARVLVDARSRFAPRLRLAAHSGLPEPIRQQLRAHAEIELRSIQGQLEDSAKSMSSSGASSVRSDRDMLLRLYRENPLTAVLDPNALADTIDDREMHRADAAQERMEAEAYAAATDPWTVPRRRVFVAPDKD